MLVAPDLRDGVFHLRLTCFLIILFISLYYALCTMHYVLINLLRKITLPYSTSNVIFEFL